MAVTALVVQTPPDTAILFDTNLRPSMTIKLTGGTGPYDITWEWDTSSGFASGNLVQAFDTGLTGDGPHTKAPGSDLGGAQVWYFRVLVTDTNDANVYTHPPSGTHQLDYQDVDMTDSYLHHQSNVGVGFDADEADGDPKDTPDFIYQYGNVGVAFGPGLPDGDPKDNPVYLHHYVYLEPTQPCPWIDFVAPTLLKQGAAIGITGDSFGATPATWGGEVRLYETADLAGAYVVLSTTSWSDKEISATIPAAGTSGWIAVVHTTGTPTCDGSEMKYVQVEVKEANPDAGWWLQTATPENALSADYTVTPGNTVRTSFRKIMNDIGSGRLELPLGDPTIQEIMNPIDRKGTLVRSYIDGLMRYGWFAESLTHDYNEEGDAVAVISGRGMEAVAAWTSIPPHDAPSQPSAAPTWVYGSNENFLGNPGFDDVVDNPILANPGGEDGNDDEGKAEGWNTLGDDVDFIRAVQSVDARSGQWYLEARATDNHSGMQQSVSCEPNKVYHIEAWVKDPLASGMRVTLTVGGADDIESTYVYANNYKYEGEIYAELDNAVRNPAHNGLPGGSTDGTWQVLDVQVMTGDEQTSLSIKIQNDHHGTGIFNPFWVDDVFCTGWGLALEPWTAFHSNEHASNSFQLSDAIAFDGSQYCCLMNPLSLWAGIQQVVEVNPNTKYTATIWAWTDLSYVDDVYKLVIRSNDGTNTSGGTQLGIDEFAPVTRSWNAYTVIFETDANTTELIFRFAYVGPNNPGPIYIDSASLVPGEPPSTAGEILNDVIDAIKVGGKLTYLTTTFSDTHDSKGYPWTNPLAMDLDPTETLYGLLSRMTALGHEWEIVPEAFAEGGEDGFVLNVYVARAYEPYGGLGINRTKEDDGPVIMPGDATVGGRVLKSVFNVNSVLAIGDSGAWARVYQHPWLDGDIQAWDNAPFGYLNSFGVIEETISVSAKDVETIAQYAEARLAEEKDKERAIQLVMQRSAVLRPFFHFGVGDTLFVDMPPTDPDPPISDGLGGTTRQFPKRVRSLQADLSGEGSEITFQVDINRVIYEDELSWYAKIAQLSERSPTDTTGSGTGSVAGTGGSVSIIGGGATPTTAVGTHTHDLKTTDIKNKALSGDVSGSLPGPVSVNAIKKMPVSNTIPAVTNATAPASLIWVYDRDSKTWMPTELNIPAMTLASTPLDTQRIKYNSATGGFEPEYEWNVLPFSKLGAIGVLVGDQRFYATEDRIIEKVRFSLGIAGTAATIIDVHMDGTTIFTTQANRPEIPIAGHLSPWETPDVTAWDADSYLTLDVDAGADAEKMMVYVRWRVA